jgi:hypothetical protein
MKVLKKIIGIISWLPDKEPDRMLRIKRLDTLIQRIDLLFNSPDILIVAQNWKDHEFSFKHDNITEIRYDIGLGITKARTTLIDEFLKTDSDYLIMADDDAIINVKDANSPRRYLKAIDEHPDGFMFLLNDKHTDYAAAQLNMCAVSRKILKNQGMIDISANDGEGFEDSIYSHLLHYKYPANEFHFDEKDLWCSQFQVSGVPSTWFKGKDLDEMIEKTDFIIKAFSRGDFDISSLKVKATEYAKRQAYYKMALFNGWINVEDIGTTC